jgi:hypothetical protein
MIKIETKKYNKFFNLKSPSNALWNRDNTDLCTLNTIAVNPATEGI